MQELTDAPSPDLKLKERRPEFSVEAITDCQSFLDLEPVWNRLVERAGTDHPFLSHEWIRTWWDCFGAGKQLHILVVRADREPVAIAPLLSTVERIYGFKVRQLRSISNDHTPRFDFILTRWPNEACRVIWNHLVKQQSHWDVIEVQQLPSGSKMLAELPRLAKKDAFLTGLWQSSNNSPYLTLNKRWEDYFKGLDGKFRSHLRNRLKLLNDLGHVRMEIISDPEKLEKALEEAMSIEASGWKGYAGTAMLSCNDVTLFYKKIAGRAVKNGWLRLHFLTVDHRKIAFIYHLFYKNRLFILKIGYDPRYASFSPGHLLCYFVLQDAFERGCSEYDLLGMADQWKLKWTKQKRSHSWVYVFSNTWRMFLAYLIKFRLIPQLKRTQIYRLLRDGAMQRLKSYGLLAMSHFNNDLLGVFNY